MADHYQTLGVDPEATDEEIKRAYKKLARQFHPDMNPGDASAEARFKEVAAAYEVLADRDRRARYDRFGTDAPGAADPFGAGLGDIFEAFFGSGSGFGGQPQARATTPRGEDIEAHVDLDLEDVVFGGEREINVRTAARCDPCDASGAAPDTRPVVCEECGGSGQVRRVRQSVLGQMVTASTCRTCGGAGERIETPCEQCGGLGRTIEQRTYKVEVPVGVDDGATLRLSGRGAAGMRGGPHGDLYVHVRVRPHPIFHRVGDDLVHALYVPFTQVVLGAELAYETLDGAETLVIPAGTESGTEFRFRNRGVPHVDARGRGDLRVEVVVEVPDDIDDHQEALLRELAEARGEEVAEPGQGLFSRIKSAFT